MKKQIGIDFGTTYTYVYEINENHQIKRIGNKNFYNHNEGIPTICTRTNPEYTGGKQKDIIGYAAVEASKNGGLNEDINNLPSMKQQLRGLYTIGDDDEPTEAQNYDVIEENIKKFFKIIFEEYDFSNVNHIVCGIPADSRNNGENVEKGGTATEIYKTKLSDILTEVINEAFATSDNRINIPIHFYEEPRLASYGLFRSGKLKSGKYLVVDLGGGTADFTVVVIDENGNWDDSLKDTTEGGTDLGGEALTKDIRANLKSKIFRRDRQQTDFDLNIIENAKLQIFSSKAKDFGSCAVIGINNKNYLLDYDSTDSNRYHLKHFPCFDAGETSIAENYTCRICNGIAEYWKNNILDQIEIDNILFVGGTSRIQPLRQAIIDKINDIQWGAKKYKKTDYSDDIVFKEAFADEGDITSVQPNRSNIVAYGAALIAQKIANEGHSPLGDVTPKGYHLTFRRYDKQSAKTKPNPIEMAFCPVEFANVEYNTSYMVLECVKGRDNNLQITVRAREVLSNSKTIDKYSTFTTKDSNLYFRVGHNRDSSECFPKTCFRIKIHLDSHPTPYKIHIFVVSAGGFKILMLPPGEDPLEQLGGLRVDSKNAYVYSSTTRLYPPKYRRSLNDSAENKLNKVLEAIFNEN